MDFKLECEIEILIIQFKLRWQLPNSSQAWNTCSHLEIPTIGYSDDLFRSQLGKERRRKSWESNQRPPHRHHVQTTVITSVTRWWSKKQPNIFQKLPQSGRSIFYSKSAILNSQKSPDIFATYERKIVTHSFQKLANLVTLLMTYNCLRRKYWFVQTDTTTVAWM